VVVGGGGELVRILGIPGHGVDRSGVAGECVQQSRMLPIPYIHLVICPMQYYYHSLLLVLLVLESTFAARQNKALVDSPKARSNYKTALLVSTAFRDISRQKSIDFN
jgi:hypothetical protein